MPPAIAMTLWNASHVVPIPLELNMAVQVAGQSLGTLLARSWAEMEARTWALQRMVSLRGKQASERRLLDLH
jgi:hypothetical protein